MNQSLLITIYLWASLAVALMIIIENGLLRRHGGRLPNTPVLMVISMVTSIWGFVVPAAMYFLPIDGLMRAVPVAYIVYVFATLVYSFRLVRGKDLPDDPNDIIMPSAYMNFCQSFGIVYLLLCAVVLAWHYGIIHLPL
ncbi:hypothetical protein [uncultured Moraxella sp.]|uniref:hypothetical protein n=1 Tax=uncultured Moraxella sp. TaxID=263769 RepID=UPI0025F63A2B|nr:hypothetical protein [uncultured Moraxella sp.]